MPISNQMEQKKKMEQTEKAPTSLEEKQSTMGYRQYSRERRKTHRTFQTAGFVQGSLAIQTED